MGRGLFFMPLVVGLVVGLLPASAAPLHEAAKPETWKKPSA